MVIIADTRGTRSGDVVLYCPTKLAHTVTNAPRCRHSWSVPVARSLICVPVRIRAADCCSRPLTQYQPSPKQHQHQLEHARNTHPRHSISRKPTVTRKKRRISSPQQPQSHPSQQESATPAESENAHVHPGSLLKSRSSQSSPPT